MVSISTQYEDFSEYYGLSRIPITSTISNYRNSYNNSRESSKETKYYNRTFHDIDLSKYDKIFENGLVYYKPKVALRPEKPTS